MIELISPENIFNMDESGFHDDPGKKLLFRRYCRHPEIIKNPQNPAIQSCSVLMLPEKLCHRSLFSKEKLALSSTRRLADGSETRLDNH